MEVSIEQIWWCDRARMAIVQQRPDGGRPSCGPDEQCRAGAKIGAPCGWFWLVPAPAERVVDVGPEPPAQETCEEEPEATPERPVDPELEKILEPVGWEPPESMTIDEVLEAAASGAPVAPELPGPPAAEASAQGWHLEENWFVCDTCGDDFQRRADIMTHLRKHVKKEPCPHGCGGMYKPGQGVSRHETAGCPALIAKQHEAERQEAIDAGEPMPASGDDGLGMPSDPEPEPEPAPEPELEELRCPNCPDSLALHGKNGCNRMGCTCALGPDGKVHPSPAPKRAPAKKAAAKKAAPKPKGLDATPATRDEAYAGPPLAGRAAWQCEWADEAGPCDRVKELEDVGWKVRRTGGASIKLCPDHAHVTDAQIAAFLAGEPIPADEEPEEELVELS